MDVGVVAIRGLSSNYYLAISKKGELYGAVSSRFIQYLQYLAIPCKRDTFLFLS